MEEERRVRQQEMWQGREREDRVCAQGGNECDNDDSKVANKGYCKLYNPLEAVDVTSNEMGENATTTM